MENNKPMFKILIGLILISINEQGKKMFLVKIIHFKMYAKLLRPFIICLISFKPYIH